MKKFTVVFVVVAVVAAFAFLLSSCGKQYDESDAGREVSIKWEMVNLREDHSTNSDVIAELHQGTKVILTGYSYEYLGGNGSATESWHEVRTTSGETGWIVTTSIQW